jgi:hypothetical protein
MAGLRHLVLIGVLASGMVVALAAPCDASGQERWKTDFDRAVVPLDEIVSGGPPKDGIPAIDHPSFESVQDADDWLEDPEPVAVVRIGEGVKAYPLRILIWHEIVNDEVGGQPVAITFCPLCNTTLAFDRRFDGQLLDFGTTGRLRHSDLIMYDRQTETWWQQATGEGIIGEYAGEKLAFIPAPVLSWGDVKEQTPGAQVLSRDTGHRREYGRNPYEGYDRRRGPISVLFRGKEDDRLPAMERVVALQADRSSLAIPFSSLERERVVHVRFDERELVVFWAPGTSSALDAGRLWQGKDVGSSAVFEARLGDRDLHFKPARDGRFKDRETASVWNLAGEAIQGPLRGSRLDPVAHGNHFWFAWIAFKPETVIWSG